MGSNKGGKRGNHRQGEPTGYRKSQVIPKENKDDEVRRLLRQAREQSERKNFREQLQIFDMLMAKYPEHELVKNCVTWRNIARCYEALGREKDAFNAYQQALKLSPGDLLTRTNLAIYYEKLEDYDAALAIYNNILSERPSDEKIINAKGILLQKMGDHAGQIVCLKQLQPTRITLLQLGRAYERNGQFVLALKTLGKILADSPSDKEALQCLAICYERMGNLKESMARLKQLPTTPDVLLAFARGYQEQKEFDKAIKEYEKFLHTDPDNEQVLLNLAICYQKMEHWEPVLPILKRLKPTPDVQMALVRYHMHFSHFDEGLNLCNSLLTQHPRHQTALLGKAMIQKKMNDFAAAELTLCSMSNHKKDPKALNVLARIHRDAGNYMQSIAVHQQAKKVSKKGSSDVQVALLGMGLCYEAMEQYDEAIHLFKETVAKGDKERGLLTQGRCYQAISRFDEARDAFLKLGNTRPALLALASRATAMGLNVEALRIYTEMQHTWPEDVLVSQSIIHCHIHMNHYEEALSLAQTLCDKALPDESKALLLLARCHREFRYYDKAQAIYEQILEKNPGNQEALIYLADISATQKQYIEAIKILRPIMNQSREARLRIASYYLNLNDFRRTLSIYNQMIEAQPHDVQAMLGKVACLQKKGSDEETRQAFDVLLSQAPYSSQAHCAYARYLLSQEEEGLGSLLDEYKQKWPYQHQLYLLKVAQKNQDKDAQGAWNSLIETTEQFPYYRDAWLNLIHHLVQVGDLQKANKIRAFCEEKFQGNPRLMQRIDNLLKGQFVYSLYPGLPDNLSDSSLCVRITDELKTVMKPLIASSDSCFVVGSTVLSLLNNKPLLPDQDIDVIVVSDNPDTLLEQGFHLCAFVNNLYQARINNRLVDCIAIEKYANNNEVFLHSDALKRDFTISSIFCKLEGDEGKIFDPTGYGIEDEKNSVLRMIGNPILRLREDPVRILRAIKYVVLGYTPTDDLRGALKNWRKTANLSEATKNHLRVVLSKHLQTLDPERYIRFLKEYDLLERLFSLDPAMEVKQALQNLTGIFIPPSPAVSKKVTDPLSSASLVAVRTQGHFGQHEKKGQPAEEETQKTVWRPTCVLQ